MTFVFSDLLGLAWIFAFPIFLHILNAYNGRNRGITVPRMQSHARQYVKIPIKPVKSNRHEYSEPRIKAKPEVKIKTTPTTKAAPVKYMPQDNKPAVTLARDWAPICCILPTKPKPAPIKINLPIAVIKPTKFRKTRNSYRKATYLPLTNQDKTDMARLLGKDIFKKINYMSICWLKTRATKAGIDDWISLLCSNSSYEDNKKNLYRNFGAPNSEDELMQKYKDFSDMARDEYENT